VKVCVGSAFPGGLDAEIVYPFEDSELFDYYDVDDSGRYELAAQTRRCLCADLIEPVIRRGVDAVIVKDLTSTSLFKFASAGVKVFVSKSPSVRASLEMFLGGKLLELTMKDMAGLAKKHREVV
jgi:predicted Fe-Mo cluster-binding NifX family protein